MIGPFVRPYIFEADTGTPQPAWWSKCGICDDNVVVYTNGRIYHDDRRPLDDYDHAPQKRWASSFRPGDTWEKLETLIKGDYISEGDAFRRLTRLEYRTRSLWFWRDRRKALHEIGLTRGLLAEHRRSVRREIFRRMNG